MKYLLDTNMCIYWFKGIKGVDQRIASVDQGFQSFHFGSFFDIFFIESCETNSI